MNHVVLSALLPVMALILLGLGIGRARWLGPGMVRRLSTLAFMVLTPILLFRSMSRVHVEQLDLLPALVYALALALVFGGVLGVHGVNRRGGVVAMAATYGNSVLIGIPLISLVWGDSGLVTLFTLIPLHSLMLLTTATVVLEFAEARDQAAVRPEVAARLWLVALHSLRKALIHPVPLPIIAGLLFAQTGLVMPAWLDTPMSWLGKAFGPLALMLVGVSLASSYVGRHLRGALSISLLKNLLVPALAGVLGWLFGMSGQPLAVMIVMAALPVGANAFLFSQRYGVAQETITASIAVSTALSAVTVSLAVVLLGG
ncbi:MAG: AEC family transporter [Rhodoferax sp.]|nr:AEC family transporter [Rhodoferax sp.]